jgi:hypothetical protein
VKDENKHAFCCLENERSFDFNKFRWMLDDGIEAVNLSNIIAVVDNGE